MARLTIEQVEAPDFSASSEMLARANESFNTGIESAKGILGKYNEGQQAKNDNIVLNEFAKAGSVEELDALLQSDMLLGLNISDDMKNYVAGLRTELIRNDATRASTESTRAATTRANAVEGRAASEYAYGVDQRTQLAGLTPAVLAAEREGRSTGSSDPSAWLRYDNQNATRNDPLAPELVDAMSFVGDMGITMRVVSGGQENNTTDGTGSTRHNHGNAADVDFYIGDRKLDWNNPEDLPIFQQIVAGARANGVTGIGAGDDYMGAGRMHVGFGNPGVWGAEGSGANAPEWLVAAYNGAPAGAAPISRTPVRSVTTGGPASYALEAALASTTLPPNIALGILRGSFDAQRIGNQDIAAAEELRQAELAAEATRAAILDPNNLSGAAVQRDLLTTPGLSFGNSIAAAGQDLSAFADVISPNVAPSAEVNAALDRANTEAAGILANDPLVRSFELAKSFNGADDMGAALLSEFEIPEGSSMNSAYANRALTRMARDAGVTPGEMAATLSSMSDGNYEQFDAMINAPSDSDIYESVKQVAQKQFNAEAKSSYETLQADAVRESANRDSLRLQIAAARVSAAKIPAGTSERAVADQQVALMEAAVVAKENPVAAKKRTEKYLASRILGFEPGSIAGNRSKLEALIQNDDSLSTEEKLLLILGLRV